MLLEGPLTAYKAARINHTVENTNSTSLKDEMIGLLKAALIEKALTAHISDYSFAVTQLHYFDGLLSLVDQELASELHLDGAPNQTEAIRQFASLDISYLALQFPLTVEKAKALYNQYTIEKKAAPAVEGFEPRYITDSFKNHPDRFTGKVVTDTSQLYRVMRLLHEGARVAPELVASLQLRISDIKSINAVVEEEYNTFAASVKTDTDFPDSDKNFITKHEHGPVTITPLIETVRMLIARYLIQEGISHDDFVRRGSGAEIRALLREGFDEFLKMYTRDIVLFDKLYQELDEVKSAQSPLLEVYLGRDAIGAYYGRLATYLATQRALGPDGRKMARASGSPLMTKPRYLVFPRSFMGTIAPEVMDLYLQQEGITREANPFFFDTGVVGSIPAHILHFLNIPEEEIDSHIKLASTSNPNRIMRGGGASLNQVMAIENEPKVEDRAIGLATRKKADSEGNSVDVLQSVARPTSPVEQFFHGMIRQALVRHYWLRKQLQHNSPSSLEEVNISIKQSTLQKLVTEHAEGNAEAITHTIELYTKTQEFVAPVVVSFADFLLQKLSKSGKSTKLVCAARDGIGAYLAAQKLLEKFPANYPNVDAHQLAYAYLSRHVVFNSSPEILERHLQELGLNPGDSIILADIGMYGSMLAALREKLPNFRLESVEYLISRTPQANGYLDTPQYTMSSVVNVVGNPAVHFLEDTYSGSIASPTRLVETGSELVPDTISSEYSGEIALKREFALRAITDFVQDLAATTSPDQPQALPIDFPNAKKRLDEFLADQNNFRHLMVPHER